MSRVCQVRHDDLVQCVGLTEFVAILPRLYNKLESPQPVFWQSKAPTDCGALWVTNEAEVGGKETIVDLLRRVSNCP